MQVLVVGESGVVKNDSLKKLDQLMWKFSGHESLDCARDLISVLGLWQSGLNDLLNDILSVLVVWNKDLAPKGFILSLNEVASLESVEEVAVGDLDELLIALSPCSLVCSVSQVWVTLFSVLTDNFRIIVLIVDQEVLWILVDVDVDFGQSVVEGWFLDTLIISCLEPLLEHAKLTLLVELIDELWDWADTDGVKELLDVDLIAVKLEKGTKYLWCGVLVNLEEINLDELVLSVVVEISGELISEVVHVTEIDQWSWIWKLGILEEVLDLDWIIV